MSFSINVLIVIKTGCLFSILAAVQLNFFGFLSGGPLIMFVLILVVASKGLFIAGFVASFNGLYSSTIFVVMKLRMFAGSISGCCFLM